MESLMEAEITGKVCTKCGIYKSLDEYYRQAHGPLGRACRCKACIAAYDATRATLKEERARAKRETELGAENYKRWYTNKNRRRANRPDASAIYRRANLRRYNLTPEQFDDLLDAQDDKCAICKNQFDVSLDRPYHIDHDHACCGKNRACEKCIRGILCMGCNTGIGNLKEDITILQAAIKYLQQGGGLGMSEGV